MLFVLTGDIQTGKTRWLEGMIAHLSNAGVPLRGVVAPGVWAPAADGFEKLGIDNVLLPSGEVVHLARRRDLALASGDLGACGQSERAGLGWAMSDDALARVDGHFARMAEREDAFAGASEGERPGLTVVDELGRLELMRGQGLASAMALLERGPSKSWPHAMAVVRRDLVPVALERLGASWEDVAAIEPGAAATGMVERALLGDNAGTDG